MLVLTKRFLQMIMSSRPLEKSRRIPKDRLGLEIHNWEALL